MAGAPVFPVLGDGWVGKGDVFVSFLCRPVGIGHGGGGRAGCSVVG